MDAPVRCPIAFQPGQSHSTNVKEENDTNVPIKQQQNRPPQKQQLCQQKQQYDAPTVTSTSEDAYCQPSSTCSPASSSDDASSTGKLCPRNDGLSLHVCGTGELSVTFPAQERRGRAAGDSGEMGKVTVSVDTAAPVLVKLPATRGLHGVNLQCQGYLNLQMANQVDDTEAVYKPAPQDKPDSDPVKDDDQCFTKSHRRNNSDYVFVSGEPTIDKYTTNTCNINTGCDIQQAAVSAFCSCEGTLSKVTDIQGVACDTNKDNTEHRNNTPRRSPPKNTNTRVNLSGPIRDNFTQLLQEIRLVTLCDHFYQNAVIDMDVYQGVVEGTRCGRTTQDGLRHLLMTLSCMAVKRAPLIKALRESGHDDIIPMLLPR